jgi:hypothetical protein
MTDTPSKPSTTTGKEKDEVQNKLSISVFGGKEAPVTASLKEHVGGGDESHIYHTWIQVSVMRRLGFLFEGGVESAGGIFDLLFLFTVIAAVVALFVFYQFVVVFAVVLVLTILSGGAALKFLRGTFIEADATKLSPDMLEGFIADQLRSGWFVLADTKVAYEYGEVARSSNRATRTFRNGIYWSLLIATVFAVFEIAHRLLYSSFYTELTVLVAFGAAFLLGVLITDVGVLMRRRLAKRLVSTEAS